MGAIAALGGGFESGQDTAADRAATCVRSTCVAIVVWVILALVLAGVELLTLSFVAVYPAIGAVAAAITAGAGGGVGLQLLVFVLVSVAALAPHAQAAAAADEPDAAGAVERADGGRQAGRRRDRGRGGPGPARADRVGTEHWSAAPRTSGRSRRG